MSCHTQKICRAPPKSRQDPPVGWVTQCLFASLFVVSVSFYHAALVSLASALWEAEAGDDRVSFSPIRVPFAQGRTQGVNAVPLAGSLTRDRQHDSSSPCRRHVGAPPPLPEAATR